MLARPNGASIFATQAADDTSTMLGSPSKAKSQTWPRMSSLVTTWPSLRARVLQDGEFLCRQGNVALGRARTAWSPGRGEVATESTACRSPLARRSSVRRRASRDDVGEGFRQEVVSASVERFRFVELTVFAVSIRIGVQLQLHRSFAQTA